MVPWEVCGSMSDLQLVVRFATWLEHNNLPLEVEATKRGLTKETLVLEALDEILAEVFHHEPANVADVITIRGVQVDFLRHMVFIRGESVHFPKKEYQLLSYLIKRTGIAVGANQLAAVLWGTKYEDPYSTRKKLSTLTALVRDKLGPERDSIETIRGFGLRFRDGK